MFALAINNNAINLYLPFSIKEFICDISDDKPVWAHAKLNEASSTLNEFIQADFSLYTEKGKKVGQINGFAAKTADRTKLLQSMTESKEIKQRLSQLTLIPDFQVYLKTIAPAERHSVLSDYLCSLLRKILSLDANIPLDNYQGFFSLGIDSLMAVELKNALQVSMKNHDLPATIIFDRPNIHELADYILTILFETNRGEPICPPDERRATIIRKDVNTLTDDEVRNDLLALLGEAKPIEKIDLKDAVYELLPAKSGLLDELKLHPKPKSRVLRGQVEIAVRATGLNFLDLLIALGRRPGGINSMGGECAGEITAVGEGVNNIKVGDAVLGIARNSFSNSVITLADLVIQKPTSLSFAQAAAIPIVFLTVHYALNHVAKIKAGDKILIHAAAGGVGLAAIQMAKRVGAEIIATAGSPPKRDFLKGLNVSHIFDSRSLVFAEQVMDITRGQGVDIVLNSLAGEFIPKSLSTVTKGGWFLEIGKTGPWSKQQVAQTYPGINYDIVALDQIVITKPNFLQTLLVETMEMFNKGELSPLPQTLFPLTDAQSAFRYMQQAKHIGKIVVTQQ
jgi:NADPH:quinone reductase-like Zn-dependent oxidoreductase